MPPSAPRSAGWPSPASLVYLALQTHQNAKHTKALIQQGRVGRLIGAAVGWSDADKCAAWIEANGGVATPEAIRREQVAFRCFAMIGALEDFYAQDSDGLLSRQQSEATAATLGRALHGPALRDAWVQWKAERPNAALKFQAFVDRLAEAHAPPA